MRRNPAKITKKVTVLTNPQPLFNSIVGAGANGTPLRVIKHELDQENEMSKNLKNGNADIARLVFRGENFKTEAQVQSWLTAGNYAETAIKAEDDGSFSVAGDADIAAPHEIEVEDGVTAFVGETAKTDEVEQAKADVVAIDGQKTEAPVTGAQKDEDALRAKAEEKVRDAAGITEDEWAKLQQSTRDKFVEPVLSALKAEAAASEPELQPVATDTPEAVVEAVAEVAKAEPAKPSDEVPSLLRKDEAGIISVIAVKGCYEVEELAEVIRSLQWLKNSLEYDAYTGNASPEVATSIRAAIQSLGTALIQVATEHVEQASKEEAPAIATEKATEATQEEVKAATAAETETTAKDASISDPVQAALLDAIKGLTASVSTLTEEVKVAKDQAEQSAKKAETLSERLEKVEATPQTRKSADVEDLAIGTSNAAGTKSTQKSAEVISAEVRERSAKEAFGIRT